LLGIVIGSQRRITRETLFVGKHALLLTTG